MNTDDTTTPPNETPTLSKQAQEELRLIDYEEDQMLAGCLSGLKKLEEREAKERADQKRLPMQDAELSLWARSLKDHLKEHRPKEYASLKAAGSLNEVVQERTEQAGMEFNDLLDTGLPYNQAMEVIRDQLYPLPES